MVARHFFHPAWHMQRWRNDVIQEIWLAYGTNEFTELSEIHFFGLRFQQFHPLEFLF